MGPRLDPLIYIWALTKVPAQAGSDSDLSLHAEVCGVKPSWKMNSRTRKQAQYFS